MKIFGKSNAAPPLDIDEILKGALTPAQFRDVTDAEVQGAAAALSKTLGKTAPVALVRRLVVSADGQTPLLKLFGPWPTWGEPRAMAFPFREALEILASPQNPENEVSRRREQEQKWADAEKARNETEIAARVAEAETRRQLSQARTDYHANDWDLLCGWQQLAARLAIAVEGADTAVAAAIRFVLAQSIAGENEFPRLKWWPGLGMENLTPERRASMGYSAQLERAYAAVGEIPSNRLHSFELMHGRLAESTALGIAEQWKGIKRAEASQPKTNSVAEAKPAIAAPPSGPHLRMRQLP